jgi:Flp pilus assembly protein TadG
MTQRGCIIGIGRAGTAAIEFACVAPLFLLLTFGILEFGRLLWTQSALQLAASSTARCVAIGASACASAPASYAVNTANSYGAFGLTVSGVTITNTPSKVTNSAACSPPSGNAFVQVMLSLPTASPVAALIPQIGSALVVTACYPLTGN